MRMKVFKCIACVAMMLVSVAAMSQTKGDNLFLEGQNLQKVLTVASQNQAITKFQAAKVVYTATEKKKMCDNQIAICRNNIKSINGGKKKGGTTTEVPAAPELELSQDTVEFDGKTSGSVNVVVTAASIDWTFDMAEGVDGEDNFVTITRSNDAKSLDVAVEANPFTIPRRQTAKVTRGEASKVLTVVQYGKPVTLSANKNLVEFGLKGGDKPVEIYTNSDSVVVGNNDRTWYVESKPDWVEVKVDVAKTKSLLNKGLSAVKGLVANTATAASADDVKTSSAKISVLPLTKLDAEYLTGRRGDIVLASQEKRFKIVVVQQK